MFFDFLIFFNTKYATLDSFELTRWGGSFLLGRYTTVLNKIVGPRVKIPANGVLKKNLPLDNFIVASFFFLITNRYQTSMLDYTPHTNMRLKVHSHGRQLYSQYSMRFL